MSSVTFMPGAREIQDPEAEMSRLAGLRGGTAQPDGQPEAEWKIALAGRDGEILVRAATVTHDRDAEEATIHQISGTREGAMTTFRDAAGEIVLQAQTAAIIYIRRM